ncbi:MAG TPA: MBL fold metallo-hydrolase [Longimicrobiaceae bacterium]|nr:MBL fold metallo-hydrolase [Longimicrobiaceae bacterium]
MDTGAAEHRGGEPDGGTPPALQVARGVWRITTPLPYRPPRVHAYLAELPRHGFLLVDGGLGTQEAWSALDAGVRAAAGGWDAVAVHVVTHMHMDHVGLAARVRTASGAPVLMGRLDAERMAHAAAAPDEEAAYRAALLLRCGAPADFVAAVEGLQRGARAVAPPVQVDGILDGEAGPVPGAPGWSWVWTPGHTAGHVSLFRPGDAVLVAGDAVLPRITPTLGVNRQRADPVGDYVGALDRLRALEPGVVLPGHGEPPADPAGRIAELRAAAQGETATVAGLLDAGAATVWELVDRRYPGRELGASTRTLALRETLAHLERLAAAGDARVGRGEDGAERYRAAAV